MEEYDVIVIGGGPAGFLASLLVKKRYGKRVLLIKKEEKTLIPCAIPYIPATLKTIDKDFLPEGPLMDAGVEILVDEVIEIDRERKIILTTGGKTIKYEKLILATGSIPSLPPIKGIELCIPIGKDYDSVKKLIEEVSKAESVTIIGGGPVGVEICEDLLNLGKKVRIIEVLPHILQTVFDTEFSQIVEEKLKREGVEIMVNTKVKEVIEKDGKKVLILEDGKEVKTDCVIVATGTRPNIELAKKCGLETQEAIKVDERMRTSDENIFAIGDCAEKKDFLTGKPKRVMLASTACVEAVVASENLYEESDIKMKGVLGTFVTKFKDLVLGATGYTETFAKREKLDVISGSFETMDKHPPSLPNSHPVKVKLTFTKEGRIIGGQIAGSFTTTHMINMISLLVENNYSINDVLSMQFASQPWLTPAPTVFPIIRAALDAKRKLGMW